MTDYISARARRKRARRRKAAAIGVGVAVVAAGGATALATTGSSGPALITAAVTTGSVTQAIEASGTVASSSQTNVSFAASGTVDKVAVKAGDAIKAGQVLATLVTTSLQSKVDSASATVASAEQKLEDDENGVTSSLASSGGSGAPSAVGNGQVSADSATETRIVTAASGGSGRPGTTTSPGSGDGVSQVKAVAKAVIDAQHAVDQDQVQVTAAQQALDAGVKQNLTLRDAATTACAANASSTDCSDAQMTYDAYADTLAAVTGTLDTAITTQTSAIGSLDAAIGSLDKLIATLSQPTTSSSGRGTSGSTGSSGGSSGTEATSSKVSTTPTTGSSASAVRGGSSSKSSPSSAASTTTSQPASAAQLAADEAQIDSAKAQLTVAGQDLGAATLKAPSTGTVAAVGYTAGSGASGSSITILGTGRQVVTIEVPLSEIDQVKVGQPVSVVIDGRTDALKATVTKIGMLSTTSGSLTTFPATVTLAPGSPKVHDGVGADVTITTGSASGVVLVPNSAITTAGTRHVVTVVAGGKAKVADVTIGLIGTDVSQVTSGLTTGQMVQLADPAKALPSSTTSSTTARFGNFAPGSLTRSTLRNLLRGGG